MSNSYILFIETATNICSVSLSENDKVIHAHVGELPNMHAANLTIFINDLLERAKIGFNQLSAVAVSKGPGSYTGLRIGVSVAKGLCYALDIPLIGNNTLDVLVGGYLANFDKPDEPTLLLPMIDARRQEVYTATYDVNGLLLQPTEALIVDENSFDSYTSAGYHLKLFGSGADKFEEMFRKNPNIKIISNFEALAEFQNKISYDRYKTKDFEDLAYFEPFYLKDFMVTISKKQPLL